MLSVKREVITLLGGAAAAGHSTVHAPTQARCGASACWRARPTIYISRGTTRYSGKRSNGFNRGKIKGAKVVAV